MTAYATIDDLQAGWTYLTDSEKARANVLLERASTIIDNELSGSVDIPSTDILKIVCCEMVRYSFQPQSIMIDGLDSGVMQGDMEGGYLSLSKKHRRMLGIPITRAGYKSVGFNG